MVAQDGEGWWRRGFIVMRDGEPWVAEVVWGVMVVAAGARGRW